MKKPRASSVCVAIIALAAGPFGTAAPGEPTAAPAWLAESIPAHIRAYVGKNGLPEAWPKKQGPLGSSVAGVDRWQANNFIVYRRETAVFLDRDYTPTTLTYRPGMLPTYDAVAARYTSGIKSAREKASALLATAMPAVCRHPTIPPRGARVPPDRALDDEALLRTGAGWCNEQARVFVRLCQVSGIPARLVFLFYSDGRTGHVVAEFYADGCWSMADTSWLCLFPAKNGRLMSAAECHDPGEGQRLAAETYQARLRDLEQASELSGPRSNGPDRLSVFGLLNYPLPP